MKKTIFFMMCLFWGTLQAQIEQITPVAIDSITVDCDRFIGTDGAKNYFYIKDNVLYKKNDKTVVQYQNIALGKISSVSFINALRLVIFYDAFNTICIVDSQLNEIEQINFSDSDASLFASAVGISGQNKLWVFNQLNQQLLLFDLLSKSYKTIGVPFSNGILFCSGDFNNFQWIDKNYQWQVGSIYGNTISNGTLEVCDAVQFINPYCLVFQKGIELFIEDKKQNKRFKIALVEKSFKNFYYKDQILSIFTSNRITNYKLNLP
ncbi:hypothetical protein [Flavobacterium aciduliphilum]|nr:hypothetical protein [Flavobacterium aciduliphilum]